MSAIGSLKEHAVSAGLLLCVALSALACGGAAPAVHKQVATPQQDAKPAARIQAHPALLARAYTDRLGTMLEFLPVRVKGSTEVHAIVRLSGVGGPSEGVPFLATRFHVPKNRDEWRVPLTGQSIAVIISGSDSTERDTLTIRIPLVSRRVQVVYDSDATRTIVSAQLIASHLQAESSGQLGRLAGYDREGRIEKTELVLAGVVSDFQERCGAVPVAIDWDTVEDESITSQQHCYEVLHVLGEHCMSSENNREDVLEQLKKVSCIGTPEKQPFALTSEGVLTVAASGSLGQAQREIELSRKLGFRAIVLRSKQGQYVTISPLHEGRIQVHSGHLPALYKQYLKSGASRKEFWMWDAGRGTFLKRGNGRAWQANCAPTPREFEEVSREERDNALARMQRKARLWRHRPVLLAREARGTYHYVDALTEEEGGNGHRWFSGPRGAAKQIKVIDVITDSGGFILVSDRARLEIRLVQGEIDFAKVHRGKRSEKLRQLTHTKDTNVKFIYSELGAYSGEKFGGLCELNLTAKP